MKTVYLYRNPFTRKKLFGLAIAIFPLFIQAQNLVTNSDFNSGGTGWTTGCSVEINAENVYGGPSGANRVTEMDYERCLDQTVCVFPGSTYTLTYKGTRRIAAATPATVSVTAIVTGLSSGTVYVNQDDHYSNTSYAYTTSTYTFTIPSGSTDRQVQLHIQSLNSTATYGAILDDIEVRPQIDMAISGPATATQNSTYNYSIANCIGSVSSYNWNFGANATTPTSIAANPSTAWTTTGARNITVALSNSTCAVALNMSVAVTGVLPVHFTSFTGALANNKTTLNFTTADELNLRYFVVEKSINGRTFDSIGRIQAYNTPGKHQYTFNEPNYAGTAWYRIRNTDASGSYGFSETVVLKNTSGNAGLTIFPSQVDATLRYAVNIDERTPAQVQVFDLCGKQPISKQVKIDGAGKYALNVSSLTAGIYFLKIQTGNQTLIRQFQKL